LIATDTSLIFGTNYKVVFLSQMITAQNGIKRLQIFEYGSLCFTEAKETSGVSIFVGTATGVYKSNNSGQNWKVMNKVY